MKFASLGRRDVPSCRRNVPRVLTPHLALNIHPPRPAAEQAHLAWTGLAGQLSLDFISHENCSHTYGAQISTSPDFTTASFVQAYACDAFTVSQTMPSWNVRVLFKGLAAGTKYYYVCGAEDLREPWSQVFTFTYNSGASRAGGPTYALLADFGFFNSESLERLQAQAYDGVFDAVLHAGYVRCRRTIPSKRAPSKRVPCERMLTLAPPPPPSPAATLRTTSTATAAWSATVTCASCNPSSRKCLTWASLAVSDPSSKQSRAHPGCRALTFLALSFPQTTSRQQTIPTGKRASRRLARTRASTLAAGRRCSTPSTSSSSTS